MQCKAGVAAAIVELDALTDAVGPAAQNDHLLLVAGLGFVAGIARTTVVDNVTINNLLPGSFYTDRLRGNFAIAAKAQGRDVAEVTEQRRRAQPSGRFGTPEEFGAACAFLCSAHAGYISGQNLLIDGGAYPGTF